MVILDTDIIIDHLRRKGTKETILMKAAKKIPKDQLGFSVVSVQELYEGKSTADEERESYMLATISPLQILPYTYEVAELAGQIARGRREPMELADAAIAATAIVNQASLLTLNKKDFVEIPDLEFLDN